jgi:hypothetical protein
MTSGLPGPSVTVIGRGRWAAGVEGRALPVALTVAIVAPPGMLRR